MRKKYLPSLIFVYLAYFTHGMQTLSLSQNASYFFDKWGYTDATAGAAAVSMAITFTGFGKLISVWIGGEISDKVGRKVLAVGGSVLYLLFFVVLLLSTNVYIAYVAAFIVGIANSGMWDAALYPAAQEATPKYAASALLGIKLFVSIAGVIFPLMVVRFAEAGQNSMSIIVPGVLALICVIMSILCPFAYDDDMKASKKAKSDSSVEEALESSEDLVQKEIDEAKAKMLVQPNKLVNFTTMFYGFVCMFIMYGGQQYTKAYGLSNVGMTEMQAASLTSVYTIGSIIAVLFWAFMMGKLRWNPVKVLFIDAIFTTIPLVAVLLIHNITVIYISIACLGFFAAGGALQAGLNVRQMFSPGRKGRNTGIYYTWMSIASVALPYFVAYMTKSAGEGQAVYIMMGLLLMFGVISIVMMSYLVLQHKKIFGYSAFEKLKD